jgi:hypothetical protein
MVPATALDGPPVAALGAATAPVLRATPFSPAAMPPRAEPVVHPRPEAFGEVPVVVDPTRNDLLLGALLYRRGSWTRNGSWGRSSSWFGGG